MQASPRRHQKHNQTFTQSATEGRRERHEREGERGRRGEEGREPKSQMEDLYVTDEVYKLVAKGKAFREAYGEAKESFFKRKAQDPRGG